MLRSEMSAYADEASLVKSGAAKFTPDSSRPLPPSSDARPLISISGIGKTFANGTRALEGIDLSVRSGEFISLLGPSGCGKSTLLRMVAGLIEETEGDIEWPTSAHDVHGRPQPDLGFVFQEPTLMPWRTVASNVALPQEIAGKPPTQVSKAVADTLAMVGLDRFAGAYPRELSGGMKMRVSIARAIANRPQVLLMDEPFAALDEITRLKLNNDLLRLWQQQLWTVLFVTHSVYESVYLSSRIVVMKARPGSIIDDIAIDAPYPRDEAFRMSEQYNAYCRRVSAALREAMSNVEDDQ